ncbi:MAG TPA: thioesterase family protein [Acetobacteraceae bacterium]|nr:thioesterase family protein [Acetobacteraceae bacterium]
MSTRPPDRFAHALDEAVALHPAGPGRWAGRTAPAYWNIVGPFGGWSVALLLQAVLNEPGRHGDPLGMTANLMARVEEGPLDVLTRCVRTNRSTEFWDAEMRQGDAAYAQAMVTLGQRPEATDAFLEARAPDAPAPETLAPQDRSGIGLRWLERYEFRPVAGASSQEGGSTRTVHWMREVDGRALDFTGLAACCDAIVPRIWLHAGGVRPVSTISLNIYFHATAAGLEAAGDDYLLVEAIGRRGHRGMFDHAATIWSRAGELLATTEQIAWYK